MSDRINGYGPGIMRDVISARHIGTRHHGGFAPRTGVWELDLECGHVSHRTDSNRHVSRAKCFKCAQGETDE